MKNQNFGDNRDLLKYDLIYEVFKTCPIGRFTYIPMLTPDVELKEESIVCRHGAIGTKNIELTELLDRSIINQNRNIGQLEGFLKQSGISYSIYAKNDFFTHEGRNAYFDGIGNELLADSLILIDPDKGIVENGNSSENLMYSELRDIYERMDNHSALMFTQRFPNDLYEAYLSMLTGEIQNTISDANPISVDDLDTIIFFLTKNKRLESRFLALLKEYSERYSVKEAE
jgi:hypothetical protein